MDNKENKSIEDELKEAYAADKERRTAADEAKSDELKAAKDYLTVLWSEIESKNKEIEAQKEELENKRLEAVELAMKLNNNELGIDEPVTDSTETKAAKRFWPFLAIAEFLVIIAFAVILIVNSKSPAADNTSGDGVTSSTSPEPTSAVSSEIEARLTQKHNDNLEAFISGAEAYRFEKMKPEIKKIDGLEYLVFTDGDISVAYKNEYYIDDQEYRKLVRVEKDGRQYVQNLGYSLTEDIEKLIPKYSMIDGKEVIVLTDYVSNSGQLPENMLVISCDGLNWFDGNGISDRIHGLLNADIKIEGSGREDLPVLLQVTTSKAVYKYGLTEQYANELLYNDYELAEMNRDFVMNIDEEGIRWSTNIRLGDEYYLGALEGELALGANEVLVKGAKFGAFVPANAENVEFNGVIDILKERPEKYLTINTAASQRYYIPVNDNIEKHDYDWNRLDVQDANHWKYLDESGNEVSIPGIDVSKYQGKIDWKKVADAGVKFAIVRMGYRGMGQGTLETDPYFEQNMAGAAAAGIDTGVYFFSQAINEKEAVEEADFVIKAISKYKVKYPVIFDTERVTTTDARANGLSYEARTDICRAFCNRIKKKGYKPMIYANTYYMIAGIDLEKLADIDLWYAVYSSDIKLPYKFEILQYSESGSIPGITGNVDLNISFVDYAAEK